MTKRILVAALALASAGAFAQTFASLDNITTGYVQNFDALGTSGLAAQPNGSLGNANAALNGVFVSRTSGAAPTVLVGTGAENAGGIYNYSNTSTGTDRALGGLRSSSFSQPIIGFRIRNTTSEAITLFVLDFDIEQYRFGGTPGNNSIDFSYRLLDASTTDAAFATLLSAGTGFGESSVSSLQTRGAGVPTVYTTNDVPVPITSGTVGALNGNLTANRTLVRSEIDLAKLDLTLEPGQDIAFRFVQTLPSSGSSAGFAIDNFRAVPEPASMAAMALGLGTLLARRRRSS